MFDPIALHPLGVCGISRCQNTAIAAIPSHGGHICRTCLTASEGKRQHPQVTVAQMEAHHVRTD